MAFGDGGPFNATPMWKPPETAQAFGQEAQYGLGRQSEQGQNYRANLGAQTTRYGLDLANNRFNRLYGLLSGQLHGGGGFGGSASFASRAGVGGSPQINTSPIWNAQQIREQINAGQASNNASTGTQQRLTGEHLASQGYAPNSPLMMALTGQQQSANLSRNSDLARETNWNAALGNSQQVLRAETARDQGIVGRQQALSELARAQIGARSSLYSALAGLI